MITLALAGTKQNDENVRLLKHFYFLLLNTSTPSTFEVILQLTVIYKLLELTYLHCYFYYNYNKYYYNLSYAMMRYTEVADGRVNDVCSTKRCDDREVCVSTEGRARCLCPYCSSYMDPVYIYTSPHNALNCSSNSCDMCLRIL